MNVYRIKEGKKEELKDGRTIRIIAKMLELNYENLNLILNGATCKPIVARALISIKNKIPINDNQMEDYLDYYFTKKE